MALTLDRRTRRYVDVRELDASEFFARGGLDEAIGAHGQLVATAAAQLGAPPFAVEVDGVGDGWTLTPERDTVVVRRGTADDALAVTFTREQFSDWAQDVRSLNAMVVGRELRWRGGGDVEISVWDSLWRCLRDGWPVVGSLDFVDRRGRPLGLGRIFTPDDERADVAHFLREAGYLHLRGWLDATDVDALSAEIDLAVPHYAEGDGRSWWARLDDGSVCCVRLQEFVDHSPTTAKILQSERWALLQATLAADEKLVQARPGNLVTEALVKPVGVVAGASNLPFHRDCHFGGHAYGCSGVDIGITVTGSGPDNGQLRVVAGSHRIAIPLEIAKAAPYLPVVGIATEPGDITVHLSCTLHESTAPVAATRKVMYTPFKLAPVPGAGDPPPPRGTPLRERVYKILLEEDEAGQD